MKQKTIRVIYINPAGRRVESVEIESTLEALQALVQGSIEIGHRFNDAADSVCYVNEEGLFNREWTEVPLAFRISDDGQTLVGPGVIVSHDEDGNMISTTPLNLSIQFAMKFRDRN